MIERDYLMRMAQQLAGVLARLLRLKEQKEYGRAQEEIEKSHAELFGMEATIAAMFDSATLAQLLGHGEKMKAMAALLFEQAEVCRLNAQPEKAQRHYHRALEMSLEASLLRREEDTENRERINALLKIVAPELLAPRYADALRRLA